MEINKLITREKINYLVNFNINDFNVKENVVTIKDKYDSCRVRDYILNYVSCSDERILDSFKMVKLADCTIKKEITYLSSSEKLKVELAILLLKNVDTLVLYHFDKYFMEKDLQFFKKLFRKLVVKYNKTIVMVDCGFSFALDFADIAIYKNDKNKVVSVDKKDFYDDKLLSYVDIPKIIDFVKYVNFNDKILNDYTDIKELIKAIYREV
jgi:energy-coupling factor transporter ATP-binding protein EcfA2